jgi:hypothetical protein
MMRSLAEGRNGRLMAIDLRADHIGERFDDKVDVIARPYAQLRIRTGRSGIPAACV